MSIKVPRTLFIEHSDKSAEYLAHLASLRELMGSLSEEHISIRKDLFDETITSLDATAQALFDMATVFHVDVVATLVDGLGRWVSSERKRLEELSLHPTPVV